MLNKLYASDIELAVRVHTSLKNLEQNPDFQELMKLYLVDNAARLASMKSACIKAKPEEIDSQLTGIAELQNFFSNMVQLANQHDSKADEEAAGTQYPETIL